MITSWTWLSFSPGAGDAHHVGLGCEALPGSGTSDIAHAGAQPTDQLVDTGRQRAFVGHHAFDAFRDQLAGFLDFFLEVAVAAPFLHGAQRTHAAVGLVTSALIEDGFTGTFLGAGKETADHDAVSSGRQGFDHIPAVLDAAVGDDGRTRLPGPPGRIR